MGRSFAHAAQSTALSGSTKTLANSSSLFLGKGFTALAIQSFTTAHNLGVIPELKAHMEEFNPSGLRNAERSLPGMCPKA